MTVRDIAVTGIETAGPDTTVEVLALTMEEKDIGSVVIEEDMEPVGIVTDRDLTVRVTAAGEDPATLTAADVMSKTPVTVPAGAGVLELTNQMCRHEVRRVPVVDEDGLVGIVTLDDVMVLLTAELNNLGNVIEAESTVY